ncbi:uncharacterized protein LOC125306200 isoform X2 [Alosa alosa]|uniref:uncharacterized protein LOC125306200 isoform X2 n=1 Tax=Alosa alosa TaxID=278164 RepID=UPI0020151F34|nr:uncharacterized protein LOC125306200 isoform X2 [Alosa alosa]
MDQLFAGSEPHGKLSLQLPLWGSIGDGGNNMDPALTHTEMEVAVNCLPRNEDEPLDLIMLQKIVAESDARAKYWSTITMDLLNTCTKVIQSANRDRQWFVHVVQQIEKTMRTAVHQQEDMKSHSQEAHVSCPSILKISSDKKETGSDDERYGLKTLVEDCRSRLGSLERVVWQLTKKVDMVLDMPQDMVMSLSHDCRLRNSSPKASPGMCSSVGNSIESSTCIHDIRDIRHIRVYKDSAVQVPVELTDIKVEGMVTSRQSPDHITKSEAMERNVSTLATHDAELISADILATATPDSRFEMMEEGVLPDSQLCPPAVMKYEQRFQMITETKDQKNNMNLQHAGSYFVESNVCKHLEVAESLKSEVKEVAETEVKEIAEAKLMSSDILLATATPDSRFEMMEEGLLPDSQLCPPAVMKYEQRHEIITETKVQENNKHLQLELLKSPAVDEKVGEVTSEALQLLPDPEDFMLADIVEDHVCDHFEVAESHTSQKYEQQLEMITETQMEVGEAKLMSSDVLLLTPTNQATDQGFDISTKAQAHELKVKHRQTSQPSPNYHQCRDTAEMKYLLKQFETATPDGRFEMMEGGLLLDSELYPPAVPMYEQRIEIITETEKAAGDASCKHRKIMQKTPHHQVPKQPIVPQVKNRQGHKKPRNSWTLEVQKLVHSVVNELWRIYDLGAGPKVLSGLPKPCPSKGFLQSLSCTHLLKTSIRRSYGKHIYGLCWEILQGIYPKGSDTGPAWYKPRPQDDVRKIKSFHDVQDYITRKVFRLSGMQTPKYMEKIQFHFEHVITTF